MTINKISITNFGKLSNLCIEPSDGMNIIFAPNESGKSTLLSFVKFIFYGTRHKKVKGDLIFKEKYMPWNGMPMSGSIEFTHMGKKYIIYRSEGAKNGSKKLEINNLITGEICHDITDPGRHFFSVGEKAFSDSCFVTDIYSVTDADDDIISMISQGSAQSASYNRVKAALDERILSLSSPKRASSRLSVINRNISDTQNRLIAAQNELSHIKNNISDIESKRSSLSKEIADLKAMSAQKDSLEASAHFFELKRREKQEEDNLASLIHQLECARSSKSDASTKPHKLHISFLLIALLICILSFAFSMHTLVSALSAFAAVFFVFLILRARFDGRDFANNASPEFLTTLDEQIAVSGQRLSDTQAEISRHIASNPDIIFDNVQNINQTNCFTKEEINDIISKIECGSDELHSLSHTLSCAKERADELTIEITALRLSLDNLNTQVSEINSRVEIYKTALFILESAFSKMRDNFAPELSNKAFAVFSDVSQNNCSALVTNEKFEAAVKIDNEYKDVRALSNGTKDLVYLALRIAISDCLSTGDYVPMFFDDVLSSFDDDRCSHMLKCMYSLSAKRQIFLCTCQKREVEFLGDCADVSTITLRKDDNNG